jgi:hypothetical protein
LLPGRKGGGIDPDRTKAAMARIRARAASAGPFDWDELKQDRDMGRP